MNTLIKQIAEQSGCIIDRLGYGEGNLEKFAELIVRECSKVIRNGGYWSGGPLGPKRQCTPPEIATMIEEHFGVGSEIDTQLRNRSTYFGNNP